MLKRWADRVEQVSVMSHVVKWFLLTLPVSAVVGSLVALFLWLLDWATLFRWKHEWLLYLLPLAGVSIVLAYRFKGKNAEAGNNLIVDEIHKPGGGIPVRMAPFVLISTVVTHLFGGSAGREGTAVQIGGSVAHFFASGFHLNKKDFRILLMTGISAGFGAVFGTPLAGTVFALEVIAIGRVKYDALLPCLFSAVMADWFCSMYGVLHTHYHIGLNLQDSASATYFNINYLLMMYVALAGVLFGLVSYFFSELSHSLKDMANRFISRKYLIPVVGGLLIIGLTLMLDTTDYLGLGVTTFTGSGNSIVNAFKPGGVDALSWFWKLLFTAVTLSTGFKGGEVTPLFFIGATLGNAFSSFFGLPVDLFAGLGFIAVFAGATNTPLACTLMGVELFGGEYAIYYAVACFVAYYFSGHSGIYGSQRIGISKAGFDYHSAGEQTLKSIRERKR